MHNYCTYFDWNYLAKGLALHESLERHCSPFHLWILALDHKTMDLLRCLRLPHASLIPLGSFEYPALTATRHDRTTSEFYWTCTPGWILYVLNHGPMDSVNYIDADLFFFRDPAPMFEEIGNCSLGVTPHDFPPKLRAFENNGIFNVGLVHVKRNETGLACIREWEKQCLHWCYLRHEPAHPGWFCDQKYLDEWPGKWSAHAIQHKGVNRAPWNAEHHGWSIRDGHIYVDDDPLLWWHFHGYRNKYEVCPETYMLNALQITHVYIPYAQALERADGRIRSIL